MAYNSTIKQKEKICASCGKPCFWFSRKRCKSCASREDSKPIARVSEKRKLADAKANTNYDGDLQKWFDERRKELVGTCQCGCGNKSQKNDDMYYKHSICHLYPKRIFKSVATHPLNFIERAFWGGCHSVLDDTSMDRWVGMADWEDIKMKAIEIARSIPKEERASKFFGQLMSLIENN